MPSTNPRSDRHTMSLLAHLALRVLVVGIVCLAGAVAWIMADAGAGLRAEAEASAGRVAAQMTRQPGLGSAGEPLPAPGWDTMPAVLTVLPGICVVVALEREAPRLLCSGWDGIGMQAPAWFRALSRRFEDPAPVTRAIVFRGREIGTVTAAPEPAAAATRAWRQAKVSAGIAAAMALATGLLGALAAGTLLAPAGRIVHGLRAIEEGDDGHRLGPVRTREFGRIARAVDTLADRLQRTRAERAALTLRLFQVQEEERRTLARDLHDEFGQCLTAIAALAGSIEAVAPADTGTDAAAITGLANRMMATLKGALARLEPPELDERGIEGSLSGLVSGWSARARATTVFHLDMAGDLAGLPPHVALSLYRIAQELLTNAVRHGTPSRVFVRVSRASDASRPVTLVVDDDGGGDPAGFRDATGRGLLGIRERVAALGGRFRIGASATGIRACAEFPTPA